jgi:putative spermidine/putrescine transport system permease protein
MTGPWRPSAAVRERRRRLQRNLSILGLLSPTVLLLLLAFVVPIVVLFAYSVYHFNGINIEYRVTFGAYQEFARDPFYWDVLLRSLQLAVVVTGISLLIGFPTAYGMSRIRNNAVLIALYVLVFSPLLTSVIIRAFGWLLLLGDSGFVNYVLMSAGVLEKPIRLIYNIEGVSIALVHVMLPFTVFPILSVMNQMDPTLKEAANDLGANRWTTFWRITWPLSLPGLLSGAQTTFVMAISAFATPTILGGGRVMVLPRLIYESIVTRDWPMAAVLGMVLLALSLTLIFFSNQVFRVAYRGFQEQSQ